MLKSCIIIHNLELLLFVNVLSVLITFLIQNSHVNIVHKIGIGLICFKHSWTQQEIRFGHVEALEL